MADPSLPSVYPHDGIATPAEPSDEALIDTWRHADWEEACDARAELLARLAAKDAALANERGSKAKAFAEITALADAHYARAEAAEAALAECHETLRRLKRTGELSAAIMRDTRRTGAWEGAERTARAFERMGEFAARALAKEARDE